MVDDELSINNCGLDSALSTAQLNAQSNLKKLQYNEQKCVKMHVGAKKTLCCDSFIDTWKTVSNVKEALSVHDFIDIESDMHCMQQVSEWKYLGDILSSDSKQDENIKERISRASRAAKEVSQMLEDLCLGEFFFQGANILRSSLFLSSLLSNSEAWVNLESLDEKLLQDILSAHSKTPKELLYLEIGNLPVSYIIRSRRLNFLHWILNEPESSLVRSFLNAQCSSPIRNDWVSQIKEDMVKLDINLTFDEIGDLSKEAFKELVKTKVRTIAFTDLLNLQKCHSKGRR